MHLSKRRTYFLIIAMLSISTIMFCDSLSKNDNKSLLMMAIGSSQSASLMQFTADGDTMTWSDCTYQCITITGVPNSTTCTITGKEGTETLVLNAGNGTVGTHNGSSTASKEYIKYTMDGIDYLGTTAALGNSTINVTMHQNLVMEGTFSGRVCSIDECLTISSGSFHATSKGK